MAYIAPRSGRVDEDILGKMGSRKGIGDVHVKANVNVKRDF